MKKNLLYIALFFLIVLAVCPVSSHASEKIRFGISPFPDTMVPMVGKEKGWYQEEGLDVEFVILGWTEVMEALSAGHIDIALNNISSVISTHEKNPQIVYWYGFNTFDNGHALMIRPDVKMKTLKQIKEQVNDHELAIRMTAKQLKGKTVITTSRTDMEQGVAAAAKRGGLDFAKDIKIIDLNPDEGLAAFLGGQGDAYLGSIPNRVRAGQDGMLEMLTGADLGPPPLNGIVTTKKFADEHQDALLKVLHVWFKTVQHINTNFEDGAGIIIKEHNSYAGSKFTIDKFKEIWNVYEHFPSTAKEVHDMILSESGRSYWKNRWDDCNDYFFNIIKTIKSPVEASDAFLMRTAQDAYLNKYSN